MLRCPSCGNTYTDETLRFCLADGTSLVPAGTDRNTRAHEPVTMRMETPVRATGVYEKPAKVPRSFKIILGLLAFVAVFGSIAMVAVLIFINKNKVRQAPAVPAAPNVAATATPDPDKERLQRELAEAQRKLSEQKNAPMSPGDLFAGLFDESPAKVNSPNDGFVALRVMPSVKSGEPLAKIPHGTTITLGYCQEESVKVAGRTGHWCITSYDGKSGWVFDAWLDKAASM